MSDTDTILSADGLTLHLTGAELSTVQQALVLLCMAARDKELAATMGNAGAVAKRLLIKIVQQQMRENIDMMLEAAAQTVREAA